MCERCGTTENVSHVIDSYDAEINDIERWCYLCSECYEEYLYAILNLIEFKNKQKQSMYKQRINLAIKLLIKLFGTDDYEINYIIGILNGQREIYPLDEVELDLERKGE